MCANGFRCRINTGQLLLDETRAMEAIAVDRLSKKFGATVALAGASFSVADGAVHAMLGENGAGKSTLVKILSGLVRPDGGTIRIHDRIVDITEPRIASAVGIETAFQEIPLVRDLTVAQNILLPDEPVALGFLRKPRSALQRVEKILAALHLEEVDPRARIRDLGLSQRQKIEIARAISRRPKILLLDEPTAALSSNDVEWLGQRVTILKKTGVTIILVTHRLQEVRRFCDTLSVLRNGVDQGSFVTSEMSDAEVFSLIVGRSVEAAFPARRGPPIVMTEPPILRVRALGISRRLDGVSFDIRPREIVGVAALQGMGQVELFNALFGHISTDSGEIEIEGRPVQLASPRDAISAGVGISLVPEDRKTQGLALKLSGRENATLPTIARYARWGFIDLGKERRETDLAFAKVNVHPRALHKAVGTFSGGNQQKIVLAKWLMADSRVLLLFDPTRGVDVGAKHEIYDLIRSSTESGRAVLFYSTEIPELIGLCDRVLVLYGGRIVANVEKDALTEDRIGAAMLGAPAQKAALKIASAQS
jgi:ribose transport system ATP-binding protein